jgi:hypothetical protein
MVYLPNEILNIIFSFVERPQTNKLIKYVIEDCYKEDYDPYMYEDIYDDYRYHYTFKEWYFLYRKFYILIGKKRYKNTPHPTFVGSDKPLYLI